MPIVVPPTDYAAGPPIIDRNRIPESEHPALLHLIELLGSLGQYERRFKHALLLFDLCANENHNLASQVEAGELSFAHLDAATNTLSGWQMIAAREGAMAIYHFGHALIAIAAGLNTCPTLMTFVDHAAFRLARKRFEAAYPKYDAIRHVVSHVAEFSKTITERQKHSIKGVFKALFGRVGIEMTDPAASHQFSDNLYDRTYCVTYEGKVHSYEISEKTLNSLIDVRKQVYSAFEDNSCSR